MEHSGQHWTTAFAGETVCRFPVRNDGLVLGGNFGTVDIRVEDEQDDLRLSHIHAAWALTLASYTGSEAVAFMGLTAKMGNSEFRLLGTPFDIKLEPDMTITQVVKSLDYHANQTSTEVGCDPATWSMIDEDKLPQNTLVLDDRVLQDDQIEELHACVGHPHEACA